MEQCQICSSGRRKEVDQALNSGMSIRKTARKFGFNKNAVENHRNKHLAATKGSSSKRSWLQIFRKAQRAGDVKEMRVAQRELDRLDARTAEGKNKSKPSGENQPAEAWIKGVRAALGFVDQPQQSRYYSSRGGRMVEVLSPADQRLFDELQAGAERHEDNEVFLACSARLLSIITREKLPDDMEKRATELLKDGK